MIASLIGGIGLFMLGMVMMTDALKALAGESLRRILSRFTGGPLKAAMTGAGVTAVVQSSTATTLATIGFVSAGMLTLTAAIGVIFGANLGTTVTSWMVATVGLKFSISRYALYMVGVGALLRLVGRGRVAHTGTALAGFALVFIGIDTLQVGMSDLAASIDPASLPGQGMLGRLVLVLVGLIMTVVMQSSSAAAATTLAAVHAGTIDLGQGCALVIGQSVGTTVTAVIAAFGAGVPARRAAAAHVMFNLGIAVAAFAVLPVFVAFILWLAPGDTPTEPAISLAAFHTLYKLMGLAIFLPLSARIATTLERIIPEHEPALTRNLAPVTATVPAVALQAVQNALADVLAILCNHARYQLGNGSTGRHASRVDECRDALQHVRRFLSRIATGPEDVAVHERHQAMLHVVDHLERMITAFDEPWSREPLVLLEQKMPLIQESRRVCELAERWVTLSDPIEREAQLLAIQEIAAAVAEHRRQVRPIVIERTARGDYAPDLALRILEMARTADRLCFHVQRATHHLNRSSAERPDSAQTAPPRDGESDAFPDVDEGR